MRIHQPFCYYQLKVCLYFSRSAETGGTTARYGIYVCVWGNVYTHVRAQLCIMRWHLRVTTAPLLSVVCGFSQCTHPQRSIPTPCLLQLMCSVAMVTVFIVLVPPLPYVTTSFQITFWFPFESQMPSRLAHLWDVFNPRFCLTNSVGLCAGSANWF